MAGAQLAWAIAIGSARPAIHCAEDSPRSHDPRSHDLTAAVHLAREERRYSPPICLGVEAAIITGSPGPKHISTSYAERSNLTMRMHMRPFTRLTNSCSKKLENHARSPFNLMCYNFIRIHQRLRIKPAMVAGVAETLWDIGQIVRVIEAYQLRPAKRGS
jgi:hypothetical protein